MKPSLAMINLDEFDDGQTSQNQCFLTLNDMADNGKLFIGQMTARSNGQNHGVLYIANDNPTIKGELKFPEFASRNQSIELTLISGDGKTLVGREVKSAYQHKFFIAKIQNDGTVRPVNYIQHNEMSLNIAAISFDGRVICGGTYYSLNYVAFIYNIDEEGHPGEIKLCFDLSDPERSIALSISRDGKIVVGSKNDVPGFFKLNDNNKLIFQKFIFKGIINYIINLDLISYDGKIIIGCIYNPKNYYVIRSPENDDYKFDNSNQITFQNAIRVEINDLSRNGKVIVGNGYVDDMIAIICLLDHNNLPQPAKSLEAYLKEFHVAIPEGYILKNINKVNGNGCIFMGTAELKDLSQYKKCTFIATLPLNSDF